MLVLCDKGRLGWNPVGTYVSAAACWAYGASGGSHVGCLEGWARMRNTGGPRRHRRASDASPARLDSSFRRRTCAFSLRLPRTSPDPPCSLVLLLFSLTSLNSGNQLMCCNKRINPPPHPSRGEAVGLSLGLLGRLHRNIDKAL